MAFYNRLVQRLRASNEEHGVQYTWLLQPFSECRGYMVIGAYCVCGAPVTKEES